jgi:hypothetical protein
MGSDGQLDHRIGFITPASAGAQLRYRFHARRASGAGRGRRRPAGAFPGDHRRQGPGASHGSDVDANGWGTLREDRLYQLVRQSGTISDRTVSISFEKPGIRAYVFTFG